MSVREVVLEIWTTFFFCDSSWLLDDDDFIFFIVDFLALVVLPLDLPPLPPLFIATDFFTFLAMAGADFLSFLVLGTSFVAKARSAAMATTGFLAGMAIGMDFLAYRPDLVYLRFFLGRDLPPPWTTTAGVP